MFFRPAWTEKTQATFQKPVVRLSVYSNEHILIEKKREFSKFVSDMQGQIGSSQSYTTEKLLPNMDDNDEIVERKISKSKVTKALICNSTFTLLVTNSSFEPRCSDTSLLRTVCFLKFVLGDRTESFEFSLS